MLILWGAMIFMKMDSGQTFDAVNHTGYLDRLREFRKQGFYADVRAQLTPIHITAKASDVPSGYVPPKEWDYESVIRLLTLLHSNKASHAEKLLKKQLNPLLTRRIFMSKQQSYKAFPKRPADVDVYYEDSYYDEYGASSAEVGGLEELNDDSVVYISNPVESMLPGGAISVKVLKEILEARARAARVMVPVHLTTKRKYYRRSEKCYIEENLDFASNTSF